jgi:hypothetical protein
MPRSAKNPPISSGDAFCDCASAVPAAHAKQMQAAALANEVDALNMFSG